MARENRLWKSRKAKPASQLSHSLEYYDFLNGYRIRLLKARSQGWGDTRFAPISTGTDSPVHTYYVANTLECAYMESAPGLIVSGPRPRLRRGLNRATVQDHRRRPGIATGELAQQRPQAFHDDLEATGPYPTLSLPIDHMPSTQIVQHHPPLIVRLDDVAQIVENCPQRVRPLSGLLPAKSQIWRHNTPLLILNIARIPACFLFIIPQGSGKIRTTQSADFDPSS